MKVIGRERRRPPHEIGPAYEDAGIYKGDLSKVRVRLVPKMARNERGDLVVAGFVENNINVNVVFPGRRRRDSGHLVSRLQKVLKLAGGVAAFDTRHVEDLGIMVDVYGTFRSQFHRDHSGWETKTHQLMAAKWSMANEIGVVQHFGEDPVHQAS